MKNSLIISVILLMFSCSEHPKTDTTSKDDLKDTIQEEPKINIVFNENNAYKYVKEQVDFGPRVPGTAQHLACYNYFVKHFKSLADTVFLQNSSAVTFDKKNIPIKNIIASFNPQNTKRIIVCAHWDTRPFADQDTKDQNKPILGANDGASGVGVIMELANLLNQNKINIGVDLILFDAEDWGDNSGRVEDSYCLGSQYWSKNLHVANYKADFGVLLDMVGAPNAMFGYEGYSLEKASSVLSLVWDAANQAGYGQFFKNVNRGFVTDDHFYMMENTQIPVIDIIDFDPNSGTNFGKYWHTHKDNMDAIDPKTLKAVGQTLTNVLYQY